jgi:hypothetical protein
MNSISSTGYVGPITIASIGLKTCASSQNTVSTPVQTANPTPTPTPTPVTTTNSYTPVTFSSPTTGQVLSIGSSTVLRWNNTPSGIYNIILEQPGGVGAGFIASNQSPLSGNQYVWKVGKMLSSQSNTYRTLLPGTYRIRIQNTGAGGYTNDQVSGWFTVVAQSFVVNTVMPTSAYADNASPVVLFGSGFGTNPSVYFDSNYSSLRANNQYVSTDGTVLVFTIPTSVGYGSHTLFINNGNGSSPVTMPFTISSIQ